MTGPYPYYGPTSIQVVGDLDEYRVEGDICASRRGWRPLPQMEKPGNDVARSWKVQRQQSRTLGERYKELNRVVFLLVLLKQRSHTISHASRRGAVQANQESFTTAIPCALPPRAEQRAIAAALSDVDALLAKLDQLIAKKRDLKQAAMQQLLSGRARLPGFSDEWELAKAGAIGRFRGRGAGSPRSIKELRLATIRSSKSPT